MTRTEEPSINLAHQKLSLENENQSLAKGACSLVGQSGGVFAAKVRVLHRVEPIDGVQRRGHRVVVACEHWGRPTPSQCRLRGAARVGKGGEECAAVAAQFDVVVSACRSKTQSFKGVKKRNPKIKSNKNTLKSLIVNLIRILLCKVRICL